MCALFPFHQRLLFQLSIKSRVNCSVSVHVHFVTTRRCHVKTRDCLVFHFVLNTRRCKINGELNFFIYQRNFGAELPATNRLPRWRIGERPSDMGVSCELSAHLLSDEQALADLQRQCHQSVEVVVGWRCLLPLSIHMLYDDTVTWRV